MGRKRKRIIRKRSVEGGEQQRKREDRKIDSNMKPKLGKKIKYAKCLEQLGGKPQQLQ